MEKRLDKVADGKEKWVELLKGFYKPFHENVEKTGKEADRASGERILGKDPETGRTVLVRLSRYGSVAQIGSPEELGEDEKPRYANLKPNQSIEKIELADALELFKFPLNLGEYEGKEILVNEGRFGPYVKYDEKFISIPRGENPLEVSKARAIELIVERQKQDAPVYTHKGLPVTKGKGRFGPFLKWNGMFINIPRRFDPETISDADMKELIEAKEEKEANRYIHNWLEDLKLSVENGRWGPFIRFGKKKFQLRKEDGKRMTADDAKEMTLEQVKAIVEAEVPDAFKPKKKRATAKKTTAKKTTAKKTTTKRTTRKKK